MIFTIRNDFHNTSVKVRCDALQHIHNEIEISPSVSQIKRIHRELCGMSDCTCGGICGPQSATVTARNGQTVELRLIINQDALYTASR